MTNQSKAVAFDLDAASLLTLREALPKWDIEVVNGATAATLSPEGYPGTAGLLVVKARPEVAETLGLCRFLVFPGSFSTESRAQVAETLGVHGRQNHSRRTNAPLVVLVSAEHDEFVKAALKAGADSCLVLPVHAKELASMLGRAHEGNQAGRHTLDLEQAQREDRWRDDGGQG
jgi:DNA-binding NarL/FixJ family response regulator